MLAAFDSQGNPSSVHGEGRAARAIVEAARREVAALAGAVPRAVVFTSGGTEAGNLALAPGLSAPGTGAASRLILGAGEHVCLLSGHRFPADVVEIAPLDQDGRLDLEALEARLRQGPALVALQAANNETGVLQPVAEAAALAHAAGGMLVCDAAQAAGRLPLASTTVGADALILSAHKFGGPKGVGAFVGLREGLHMATPLLRGGGQERGARGGTENVPAIAGFGAAARAVATGLDEEARRVSALRDRLERAVRDAAPEAVFFGAAAPRLPNTSCFGVPGVAAAMLLMRLDLDGAAASSGSACSSGKVSRSHVLAAMGVSPDLAEGAIQLSLGWASSETDAEVFAHAFRAAMKALRRN